MRDADSEVVILLRGFAYTARMAAGSVVALCTYAPLDYEDVESEAAAGSDKRLNAAEYSIFLKGGIGLDRSTQATNPASDWVSTQMWTNLTELEHLEEGAQED